MLLIVDDSALNRQVLAEQLTARGHQVVQAEGGAEALAVLDKQTFDAVILDVMMPGVDGLTVLRRIRQRFSLTELPVVMATARDHRLDMIEALKQGANDYVTKPLDFAVVYARLQTQLALKRATDEIRQLNAQLEAAHERIARLSASSSDALRDVGSWSRAIGEEIASVVGATSIGVWLLEGTSLWSTGELPPTPVELAETMEKKLVVRGDDTLFAITSIGGDVYGALVVAGRNAWRAPERQLLDSFARQLGSALEVQRMRTELATAQTRLQLRRQELLDRGIDILQVCPKCGRCYDHRRDRCGTDGALL